MESCGYQWVISCYFCSFFEDSACYRVGFEKQVNYQEIIRKVRASVIVKEEEFDTHSHIRVVISGTDIQLGCQSIFDIFEYPKSFFLTPKTKFLSVRGEREILTRIKAYGGDDVEIYAVHKY